MLGVALVALVAGAALAGCGGDGRPAPPLPAFRDIKVEWFYCSLHPGENDGIADCAETQMPRSWDDPKGPTVPVYAKRLLTSVPATGQLWLLAGGPGASGTVGLADRMDYHQQLNPDIEVYAIDARGTGYSDYLTCPDQEAAGSDQGGWITAAEVDDCVARVRADHGDVLGLYGMTQSAIDLAAYIHAVRKPGTRVFVWGGSAGAYWAQRHLTQFPDQVDGVVLEGIPPADFTLGVQDEYDEKIGRRILALCAADAFCSGQLPDPEASLRDLKSRLAAGHCPEAESRLSFGQVVNYLASYFPFHAMIPGIIYRLHRCEAGDLAVYDRLVDKALGVDWPERYLSQVTNENVIYSELWESPRFADNAAFLAYLDGVYAGDLLFAVGQGYHMNDAYLRWPRTRDPLDDVWARTTVPMLMLQGELDPATPYDFSVEMTEHFAGPHQTYVSFPYGAHNVFVGTPVASGPPPLHCADRIFSAFLVDPVADLDTSCVAETLPPDFLGTHWAPRLQGAPDYWENASGGSGLRPRLAESRPGGSGLVGPFWPRR
ncbi:MAG: alpha/beta hydrolase [Deltaproteobacteria bacterium]|nr:alpha/beta hydrolase [Deltaproteobacteria bacterium]